MKNIYALICGIAVVFSSLYAQNGNVLNKGISARDNPNVIQIDVTGGEYGFADELYIYFIEGATPGYDIEMESIKWYSIYPDATMIWSIASDETELAINAMPLHCLYNGMTSIPIHFECGYNAEYTFTFDGFDSFEYPTEFWLQDVTREDDWLSITDDNNTFTFQGYVTDANIDRFIMHFLDPTGIETKPFEPVPAYEVHIRSLDNYAIIETDQPEQIREIQVFDLVGNEIMEIKSRHEKLSKYYISNQPGYYFVKVITQSEIFTKKLFIGQ